MKNSVLILLIIITGCQTTKIRGEKYKVSRATTELGSIGQARSFYNLDNGFSVNTLPVLENRIRLDVHLLPFSDGLTSVFNAKQGKNDGLQRSMTEKDSLSLKSEFVEFSIMDITGFAAELNAPYNKAAASLIKDNKKISVVSGVAVVLPAEAVALIREADTYYLVNSMDKKYTVSVYSKGKKTGTVDLGSGVTLAYTIGKFCWSPDDRGGWYIADIVKDSRACKGNTSSRIREEKQTNLFKM